MAQTIPLTASAIEAIAEAQMNYGVPDRLVAQIAQCTQAQIARSRERVGWTIQKFLASGLQKQAQVLKGSTEPSGQGTAEVKAENNSALNTAPQSKRGKINLEELKARTEQLQWRLIDVLTNGDSDKLDPLLSKQIDAVGVALKHLEKLELMVRAIDAMELSTSEQVHKDPAETARVLRKIEKRVHDLADQRARDIIGGAFGGGSPNGRTGVDNQRAEQSGATDKT